MLAKTMKFGIYLYLLCMMVHNSWNLSDGYRYVRLQDYLCADKLILALQKPFRGDPSVHLSEGHDSAAILTQVWNTTMPGVHGSNKLKYDCNFRVITPLRGIYTLITRLKFRHTPTGECMDYIQFSKGNRSPSERICNDISIDGPSGRLIFDQRDRDVSVHVHIDKQHMIREPLELHMVLTTHTECKHHPDYFQCNPTDPNSCISQRFVRDNISNCMYPCLDEASCFQDAVGSAEIDATNVALSAITSLIFTMLGVGFCVWVCWKYWNCITVQQHAHEASAAAHLQVPQELPVIDMATAPAFDGVVVSNFDQQPQVLLHQPQTPKDLPPSYEELFPSR